MRVLVAIVVVLAGLLPSAASAAGCGFKLGFKTIADQLPATVGSCLEDEHANPANGDALQKTTGGLLVWRKADNVTAFTDGDRSWVNGPYGLQSRLNTETFDWEARTSVATAPAVPACTATPAELALAGAAGREAVSRAMARYKQESDNAYVRSRAGGAGPWAAGAAASEEPFPDLDGVASAATRRALALMHGQAECR